MLPMLLMAGILFLTGSIFLYFRIDRSEALDQYDVLSFCESIPVPVFSVPEGIYDQPFELEISAPSEYDIYFTTDGSTPTTRSRRYQKRIHVDPKINLNPNILYISSSITWRFPYGRQNHCTVFRARCFKTGVGYGAVKNMIYNSTDITQHQGFHIIHLLMEPDSLFSPTKGIYVVGEKYYSKKALAANEQLPDFQEWFGYPANFYMRGRKWRRPAAFILMNLSGETLFEQNITVNVRGVSTRALPEKSLRIMPDSPNDTVIRYPLFDELPYSSYKNAILKNSGHDFKATMLRDVLIHRLADGTRVDHHTYAPSVVYINGNYWGIHHVTVKLDENYLVAKYASSLPNITIIDYNAYRTTEQLTMLYGDKTSVATFKQLLDFIHENSLVNDDTYRAVCTQIDVDNFIDYVILETFFANWDWPIHNVRIYRFDQQTEFMIQQGIDAGKWRWWFFDLDGGMETTSSINMFETIRNEFAQDVVTQIFFSFMENEDFKEKFIARCEYLLKNHLSSEKMLEEINSLEAKCLDEMKRHIARWRNLGNIQLWQKNVEKIKKFAEERPANVLEQLKSL